MLNKRECKKCGKKISKSYEFCPHCGSKSGSNEGWGLLGKDDIIHEQNSMMPMDALFNNGVLGKMLGNAMKMLEKELAKNEGFNNANFELIVNGKRVDPRNIKISKRPIKENKKKKTLQKPIIGDFFQKNETNFSNLPKENPLTNVRRFSDKIVYEIELPGVKSIKNVSIIPLEQSIEIKAIGENKIYSKLIPVNFPITGYSFNSEKLILELDSGGN